MSIYLNNLTLKTALKYRLTNAMHCVTVSL